MQTEEIVFGIHAVKALLQQASERVEKVFIQEGRVDQRLQELLTLAEQAGILPKTRSLKELDSMAGTEARHQGVVAKCRAAKTYTEADMDHILAELSEPAFILILDGVQDPHNLGACLRSANAAGIHMVIAPKDRSVGLTPAVRKVACGAAEITPFIQVTNLARTLKTLKEQGVWLYGAAGEATSTLYQTDLKGAIGLVLGAEGEGLRRLTRELCDGLINIPMRGTVESLNVSVATGICLFEAVRQRL